MTGCLSLDDGVIRIKKPRPALPYALWRNSGSRCGGLAALDKLHNRLFAKRHQDPGSGRPADIPDGCDLRKGAYGAHDAGGLRAPQEKMNLRKIGQQIADHIPAGNPQGVKQIGALADFVYQCFIGNLDRLVVCFAVLDKTDGNGVRIQSRPVFNLVIDIYYVGR